MRGAPRCRGGARNSASFDFGLGRRALGRSALGRSALEYIIRHASIGLRDLRPFVAGIST
ncbi:MAG: hypothetical protein B6A08_01565 [Sorangiineae bacterium NIC37A_2]|nr:MAG: hypothetical protein B6A08_01565 [Sorangiineae bacterium NIC37A_2]